MEAKDLKEYCALQAAALVGEDITQFGCRPIDSDHSLNRLMDRIKVRAASEPGSRFIVAKIMFTVENKQTVTNTVIVKEHDTF